MFTNSFSENFKVDRSTAQLHEERSKIKIIKIAKYDRIEFTIKKKKNSFNKTFNSLRRSL